MIDVQNKLVAVVGMGKSGFAAVELLLEHSARVRAIDSNPSPEMKARLTAMGLPIVEQNEAAFNGAQLIVQSPGVPLETLPSTHVPIIGEVELAGYFLQGPTIGVTGSNGKTTTTALIAHILKESGIACQVGGNIGTAPTSMVAASKPEQWNVLELSSFQLETIYEFRAKIGLCLNVTQNHLDRHGTLARYADAKARLFETQDESCFAVLNSADLISASFAKRTRGEVVWFGPQSLDGDFILNGGERLMAVSEVPLRGRHNVENVMAAAEAARLAGAALSQIRAAVMTFEGVEHRIEFVRNLGGVDYYNDSKATSVDATLKAVDAFPGGLWIILGGKDKGSDYTALREPLRNKAKAVLLIGAAAEKISRELGDAVHQIACGDLANAVRIAREGAVSGDTVLLAPACASFDQFQSYEHRGRMFKELVRDLS
jgi:UDP-N-acetylmuramoylalanine--D-glutamate ligase